MFVLPWYRSRSTSPSKSVKARFACRLGVNLLESRVTPAALTPAQVTTAYGVNLISFGGVTGDGTNQTIAIVDAFDAPNIASDLAKFDSTYGLSAPPSFTKAFPSGTKPSANYGWSGEISLDVEWSHAIAPAANIVLVEAKSANTTDLYNAVLYARALSGVSVVSMSFGLSESSSDLSTDPDFTTPTGHTGVTFVASAGDSGNQSYPALSPNVVGVGGTTLNVDSSGNYISETGWSSGGGGVSSVEPKPPYQSGLSYANRAGPDIALDADPNTGVSVYFTYPIGRFTIGGFQQVGGTSAGAPMWAGLFAIANQGRALALKTPLDGPSQTLPALYGFSASDFHDITSGANKVGSAGPGFDLVTGLGTPHADLVVADLVAFGGSFAPALAHGGPGHGHGVVNPSLETATLPTVTAAPSFAPAGQSVTYSVAAPTSSATVQAAPVTAQVTTPAAAVRAATGVSAGADATKPLADPQVRFEAKPTNEARPILFVTPANVETTFDFGTWAGSRSIETDTTVIEPTAVKAATTVVAPVAEEEGSNGLLELSAASAGFLVLLGCRVEMPEDRDTRRRTVRV
jgi:subtilase family serine protease